MRKDATGMIIICWTPVSGGEGAGMATAAASCSRACATLVDWHGPGYCCWCQDCGNTGARIGPRALGGARSS